MPPKRNIDFYVHCFFLRALIFSFSFAAIGNLYSQNQKKYEWNIIESPIYSDLIDIEVFPDGNCVALGKQLIKYTDDSWKIIESDFDGDPILFSAPSINSIFVVIGNDYQDCDISHYDGNTWKNIFNPLANRVYGIDFKDSNYGIIGGIGEIAVYKNGEWGFLNVPHPNRYYQFIITADYSFWIMTRPKGLYFYQNAFKLIENTDYAKVLTSHNGIIYFIQDTVLYRIENNKAKTHSLDRRLAEINSFEVLDDDNIYAVGNNGLIMHYSNKKWSKQSCPVNYNLNKIKMLSDTLGWIVGDQGTLLKLSENSEQSSLSEWKGFKQIDLYLKIRMTDDEYGVVSADFDGDGLTDIFTCSLFGKDHLYMNQGNKQFNDEAESRGITEEKGELNLGCCAGDLDNDGDNDLYVSVLNGKNKIYKNTGDGYFVDYSDFSNATGDPADRTNSIAFGDVDNDGDLDIFTTNEYTTNRLFVNNGAGVFKEITEEANLRTKDGGTGCAFADIDNDGDIDLYVANWSRKNILYRNLFKEKGELYFADITNEANVGGETHTKSNAVVFADIDNDADPDLFVTNRRTSNKLYINDGNGFFEDKTDEWLGRDSMKSYGASLWDFDLDGFCDLYLANVGDNVFYKNIGGKKFRNFTNKYVADLGGYSTGTSVLDFDNDGDYDLYVANYIGAGSTVFENTLNNNGFIKITIEGVRNNRSGIGTKIFVYPDGKLNDRKELIYFCEVSCGESYASMSDVKRILPVMQNEYADIKLVFPSGDEKILKHVKRGSQTYVSDLEGFERNVILTKNFITRIFLDTHTFIELIKWVLFVSILIFSGIRGRKKLNWSMFFIFTLSSICILIFYIQLSELSHKHFLLSGVLPFSSVILILMLFHLYYERKMIKEHSDRDKIQIREKLSRDLHDDLSGTIGSISIYLELLKKSIKYHNDDTENLFGKIERLIGNTTETIADLIWTIRPSEELITKILARINDNFISLFRHRGIELNIESDLQNTGQKLGSIEKQNVYLFIKEALTNALKYSEASRTNLKIAQQAEEIRITIEDNGIGFDVTSPGIKGNGLINMRKRAKEINGILTVDSAPGEGTKILLKFNMT